MPETSEGPEEEPVLQVKNIHTSKPPDRQPGEGWLSAVLREDNTQPGGEPPST